MDSNELQKKTLRDYFPAEIEGIGSFETLSSFLKYCNVSNNSARTLHDQHSDKWIEKVINKDSGPFYFEDVEYKNKTLVAKQLGITGKKLTIKAREFGGNGIQDYLDHLEENKLYYEDKPVYNAQSLSEATGLDVMACSGIMRRLKECHTIEEKQMRMSVMVVNRKLIIEVVNRLDPTVDNVTDFTRKYRMPKATLIAIEELDAPLEHIECRLKKYVEAV